MTCWAGLRLLRQVGADARRLDPRDEVADDGEVDVGLEQGDADLATDLVDVGLAEAAPAAQAREDAVETVAQ